ncbi:PaREP1 family protein [Pyrolobus fumarii 1A]|uniref:PaREP1 family protein n=1 Tax=Pyrolobus fumarii (strain DSM 11204 / 1A) TaxID=694429 RepID=G0EG03_PYRF1|nr:PaREP1 family protein [Pyrolobus fumarii]AEM39104.1 PaREP1 family protein [Pyrolobus fumarii 1A]
MVDVVMGVWMALETIVVPASVVRRLREEAEKLGLSPEEYLVELVLRDLDPPERAREYIEASKSLLEQAREELTRGNVRQAAEKAWGAAALAVKAYAAWRDGRRLASHGELWEYMRHVTRELGDWVRDAWMYANGMHTCFYEGWCSREDVEKALEKIERLVSEIERRICSG